MEYTVTLVIPRVAILATCGSAHLLVTADTAQVVGPFQPRLILVVKRRMLVSLLFQRLRSKWLG